MYTPELQETPEGGHRARGEVPPRGDDASFAGLFRHLTHEVTSLMRNEVDLAKAETSEKISQVQSGISAIAFAGAIALSGLVMVLWAASLFIDPWIAEPWLSPLIVGGVALLIGLVLFAAGRSRLKAKNLAPRRTAESLRRDREAVEAGARRMKERST